MNCNYDPYALPQIDFIGGETQDLQFNVYFYANKLPYDLSFCTANFAVSDFMNRSTPIISKQMTVHKNTENDEMHLLRVTLTPKETVNLCGKYVYQITMKDDDGETEIPRQGILMIYGNINKGFIG